MNAIAAIMNVAGVIANVHITLSLPRGKQKGTIKRACIAYPKGSPSHEAIINFLSQCVCLRIVG
jgi:hypothetical protein